MRVELAIDGGFAYVPGLAKPMVVDGAQLSGEELAELRRRCHAAFAAAARGAVAPLATLPDARRYRITVEIDGKRHEVIATDPIGQPTIAELIEFVKTRGAR